MFTDIDFNYIKIYPDYKIIYFNYIPSMIK